MSKGRLFVPFTRGEKVRERGGKGKGLAGMKNRGEVHVVGGGTETRKGRRGIKQGGKENETRELRNRRRGGREGKVKLTEGGKRKEDMHGKDGRDS